MDSSITWPVYLARGVIGKASPVEEILYHMCNKAVLESQFSTEGALYFPPTYEADGFIHATGDPNFLLDVGTHFYKEDKGDWVCLKLNHRALHDIGSKIVYEAGRLNLHLFLRFRFMFHHLTIHHIYSCSCGEY